MCNVNKTGKKVQDDRRQEYTIYKTFCCKDLSYSIEQIKIIYRAFTKPDNVTKKHERTQSSLAINS